MKPAHWMKARLALNVFAAVSSTDVAGAQTNRDIAAHRAVFSLVAGIGRDVTARTQVLLLVLRSLTLPLAQPQVMLPLSP